MQKFLSSIASKIILPCLNGLPLSVVISEHGEFHHLHPRIEKYFSAELLFFLFFFVTEYDLKLLSCVFVSL